MKPLCFDLFAGVGGWSEGFMAEGWDCVGFDIERHVYGEAHYPAQLVLQDVLTLHGSQFRDAACIVASPPCQKYSWMAMPWSASKREVSWQLWQRSAKIAPRSDLNDLFDACFRIQREASEAAGHRIPLVIENVKGAQPWVGRAKAHFGSFYLWGDVESVGGAIVASQPAFGQTLRAARRGQKVEGARFTSQDCDAEGVKQRGSGPEWFDKALDERRKQATATNNGGDWFGSGADSSEQRRHNSRSDSRKAASAMIAKIPFSLASYIARAFKP